MAKLNIVRAASNGLIVRLFIQDSTSTTGAGKTGLTKDTASLQVSVMRELDSAATVYAQGSSNLETITTLGTYAAPTSGKCRFKEIDSANLPGWYEIQLPQAIFGTGDASRFVSGMVLGASGMAPVPFEIALTADDAQVAKPTNYASLSIDASGRVDVIKINGTSQTARDIGASVLVGDKTGFALTSAYDSAKTAASQTSVDTVAGYVDTEVAAIKAKTDNLPSDPADASDIAAAFSTVNSTLATIAGYIDTEVAAIKAKTDNLPASPAAVGSAMTLTVAYDAAKTAAQAGDAMTLTAAYDAAKTAATQASVDAIDDYVDTEVAAIKAKTDNLPASPAATGDIPSASTVASQVRTELTTELGRIDAAVSSRSTYAGADTSGTTTLLSRLTSGRASNLDNLDAAISTRSTYAGADTAGTTTLLSRITALRAAALDLLDAAISTRLASGSYTAPDNAGISTLLTRIASALTISGGKVSLVSTDVDAIVDAVIAGIPSFPDVPTAGENADALLDAADGVETDWTPRQALRIMLSALAGILSGAGTTTVAIRDANDTKARITADVDSSGNRTGFTYDKD